MGLHAPPVTYAVEGKQYVAFPLDWGGWSNGYAPGLAERPRGHLLLVFALPGHLLDPPPRTLVVGLEAVRHF